MVVRPARPLTVLHPFPVWPTERFGERLVRVRELNTLFTAHFRCCDRVVASRGYAGSSSSSTVFQGFEL